MEKYNLYWIEKEVARHFYHKGDILYRFLLEYINTNSPHTAIQYEYITNYIPRKDLTTYIMQKSKLNNMYIKRNKNKIHLSSNDLNVDLIIQNKNIVIYAKSLLSAEKVVFPILRDFKSSFFIVGEDRDEYGWISPFLRKDYKSSYEKLYSFL